MPLRYVYEGSNKRISCFERTPPLSSHMYAFTVFDRTNTIKILQQQEDDIPDIEILFSDEDNNIKPKWMITEAEHVCLYIFDD